jgi:hypothetical protein
MEGRHTGPLAISSIDNDNPLVLKINITFSRYLLSFILCYNYVLWQWQPETNLHKII